MQPQQHPGHWLNPASHFNDIEFEAHWQRGHLAIAERLEHQQLRYLDAGCGHGGLSRRLAECLGDPSLIEGCDLDAERIEFCRQMNPAIGYFEQDLLTPLPEGKKYDVIFLTAALAQFSLSQQQQVLSHLRAALNDGGFLWVVDVQAPQTDGVFAQLSRGSQWQPYYDQPMSKRILGRWPAILLAQQWPFWAVKAAEWGLPGDWMLRQLIVRQR